MSALDRCSNQKIDTECKFAGLRRRPNRNEQANLMPFNFVHEGSISLFNLDSNGLKVSSESKILSSFSMDIDLLGRLEANL